MTYPKMILVAVALLIAASQPVSAHHAAAPVVKPIAKALGLRHIGGGTGGALVGIFVVGVAVAIIIHEITGPKCARKDAKNGYNQPTFWRPKCARDPIVSVRG